MPSKVENGKTLYLMDRFFEPEWREAKCDTPAYYDPGHPCSGKHPMIFIVDVDGEAHYFMCPECLHRDFPEADAGVFESMAVGEVMDRFNSKVRLWKTTPHCPGEGISIIKRVA
jgi:hypothetical protein